MSEEIANKVAEAGVIATLIQHPEFSFFSEHLLPNHFANRVFRCMYAAICNMAQREITNIDAMNLFTTLNTEEATKRIAEDITIEQITAELEMSETLARHTPGEYKLYVDGVLDAAFRRDTLRRLKECESYVKDSSVQDVQQKIYEVLDETMMEFSTANELPQYSEVVDDCWHEIQERSSGGYAGIPFKFPLFNEYVTMERGELVTFGAAQKQGKSMMLLNCAVDLLKQGYSVLYIDSELNTRLFTARMLAHLTGIRFKDLTSGKYSDDDAIKIREAIGWLKEQRFIHLYLPLFDPQTIYTATKRAKHTMDLDVLIVDYFKSSSDGDAYTGYAELGRLTDLVKNTLAGALNIVALSAAQATSTGKLADSAKIARNASTIIMLLDKTPDEIERDGPECGNKKAVITFNRNGPQTSVGEWIDMQFDGDHILYEQAEKQHIPILPY